MNISKTNKEFSINELNAILNALPDGLIIYDKEGNPIYINDASKKIFESHHADENNSSKERVKASQLYTLDGKLVKLEDTPLYKALNYGRITKDFIVMSRSGSGSSMYTSVTGAPILDDNGEIVGAVATQKDITESKKNKIEVAFQSHLLESVHDAIAAIDENYIITYWNGMAQKMFGWTAEEAIGKPSKDIFKTIVPNSTVDSVMKGMHKDGFYVGEVIYHHKDGRAIYSDVHSKVIWDKYGNFKGTVSCFRDITERKNAEAALKESEQLYRKLFDNSRDGFALTEVIYDNNGNLVDGIIKKANQAFGKYTGIPGAAVVGKRTKEFDPNMDQEWFDIQDKVLKTGELVRFEKYQKGINRYHDVYIFPHSQNTVGVLFTDITERKLAEKKLKENQELLNAIIQAQAVGVSVLKAIRDDKGKIIDLEFTFANDIKERTTGGLELEGMRLLQILPKMEEMGIIDIFREVIEKGKSIDREVYYKDSNVDGWIRLIAVKFEDGIVLNIESITKRKKDEQELIRAKENLARRAEDKYLKLFNSIDEGLCIAEVIFDDSGKPADSRIIEVNPAFASQIGLRHYEGNLTSGLTAYVGEYWFKIISMVALTGKSIRFEGKIKGSNRWLSTYAFKTDKDNKGNVALLLKDITRNVIERKELKEALEMQEQVFANVSHELKTPLNVIFSANQLMELYMNNGTFEQNKEKVSKSINAIKQNCYRFTKLINNIVDLSKIEAGFFKVNLSNENIVDVTEDIVQSVSDYIKRKGISIAFDTNTEEKIIAVDADKIERIILNLISNAIKFTNPGGSIFVNLTDKKDSVEISVQDSGIGMDKEQLDQIFERFHQVDKSLSRNTEGSGIGLSLVKSIVEFHGGIISVDSELGKGSIFKIELPAMIVNNTEDTLKIKPRDNKIEIINIEFSDIYSM